MICEPLPVELIGEHLRALSGRRDFAEPATARPHPVGDQHRIRLNDHDAPHSSRELLFHLLHERGTYPVPFKDDRHARCEVVPHNDLDSWLEELRDGDEAIAELFDGKLPHLLVEEEPERRIVVAVLLKRQAEVIYLKDLYSERSGET